MQSDRQIVVIVVLTNEAIITITMIIMIILNFTHSSQ